MGVKSMNKINTKTIINYLPFPSDFKLGLLEKYDSLPNEEKNRIADLVWEAYGAVYEIKVRNNLDKLIAEADAKGQKTDDTFYKQAVDRTDEEIRTGLASETEVADLSEVRKSMELIVNEINASKASGVLKN